MLSKYYFGAALLLDLKRIVGLTLLVLGYLSLVNYMWFESNQID